MSRMCTSATLLTPLGPRRVMTTHLEFHAKRQPAMQARALVDLHTQACAHAAHPPLDDATGQPLQNKVHTPSAILCGDFNFETRDAEYRAVQAPPAADATRLIDACRGRIRSWPTRSCASVAGTTGRSVADLRR